MKNYLNKEDYNIKESAILVAPTGAGKTTALIEYLRATKEQCIFVSPLNAIGKQVYEKASDIFELVNCETSESKILGDIHYNLMVGNSIAISLTTFIRYKDMFYHYPIYIDECHSIIEYHSLMDTEELAQDIRNKKFKKIVGLTATSFGLHKLLGLKEIKPKIIPISKKNIELSWIKDYSLSCLVGNIYQLYLEHKKIVVLYNNTKVLEQISNELIARGLNVKIYHSKFKNINIVNEYFDQEFDILLCTSALATGVSIKNNYYSIYIHRIIDSMNIVPQFFSRNRNLISYGCILKRHYSKEKLHYEEINVNEFYNKTDINMTFTEFIMNNLQNIACNMTKNVLEFFINYYNDYSFKYGKIYDYDTKLLIEQPFVQYIEDIKKYFIENSIPKFNKGNYYILHRLYELYDILINGYIEDEILNRYIIEYRQKCKSLEEMIDRTNFYNELIDRAKQYKCDYSMNLAQKCTENSLNAELFEELFLDKPYKKSTFKQECIKYFVLKDEIFKNQNTINTWLNKVGYTIRKTRTGHIIRKL